MMSSMFGFTKSPTAARLSSDPTAAWQQIESEQTFEKLETRTGDWNSSVVTRVVCISDTHGQTNEIAHLPPGDILIHAGDFTNTGEKDQVEQLSSIFAKSSFPPEKICVIAGNHDITFQESYYESVGRARFHRSGGFDVQATKSELKHCTYLEDSSMEIAEAGIRIFGSPWQPEFCDWAFNLPRGAACKQVWEQIPAGVDILVTHGPPLGRGDLCLPHRHRAGCADLLQEVQDRVKPRLHVFGHVHEGYGLSSDGTTVFVNASTCTLQYAAVNPPIVIDLPHERSKPPVQVVPSLTWSDSQVLAWLRRDGRTDDEAGEVVEEESLSAVLPGFKAAQQRGAGIDGAALITMPFRDIVEHAQVPPGRPRRVLISRICHLRARCYGGQTELP